ncbi:MAG: hypothetical protein HY744_11710 [Deltaproteobacteria bacterium]|nr:hypothetical protein [Deltaproteobacteria bacterium]
MQPPPHEPLVELLRSRPAFAAALLRDAGGLALSDAALGTARSAASSFAEIEQPELRADQVVLLGEPEPELAAIVELQLCADADKPYVWPLYVAGLRRRKRCPVKLLVVTLDRTLARRYAQAIELGCGRIEPLVVGPDGIVELAGRSGAAVAPELALLAVLAQPTGPGAEALGRQVLEAVIEGKLGPVHADLVLSYLQPVLASALEDWMSQHYEPQHPLLRQWWNEAHAKGKAEGEAKGKAEGEARGKAAAILAVLAARGLAMPAGLAEQIRRCTDLPRLDEWARRAALVESAEQLLA